MDPRKATRKPRVAVPPCEWLSTCGESRLLRRTFHLRGLLEECDQKRNPSSQSASGRRALRELARGPLTKATI